MSINLEELNSINNLLKQNTKTGLLIVTKNRNISDINQLINLGYTNFGENKVQEAKNKFQSITNDNLNLHLIGPLQTNKVRASQEAFWCCTAVHPPRMHRGGRGERNLDREAGEAGDERRCAGANPAPIR